MIDRPPAVIFLHQHERRADHVAPLDAAGRGDGLHQSRLAGPKRAVERDHDRCRQHIAGQRLGRSCSVSASSSLKLRSRAVHQWLTIHPMFVSARRQRQRPPSALAATGPASITNSPMAVSGTSERLIGSMRVGIVGWHGQNQLEIFAVGQAWSSGVEPSARWSARLWAAAAIGT